MFQDLMSTEGVTVLSKQRQTSVNGGGKCRVTYTSGGTTFTQEISTGLIQGPNDSIVANTHCVQAIEAGWDRCQYDCAYDGFGR
ncbi:hypothetical protein [Nonlabens xiamenensis]|uniref:hypothetical protein n=1 Tax=Nonlabens xiamenensis TaxID=2341043 RepID=UPI0013DE4145|nr:hypothetical protein [Nonlabens xiamenensis]